MPGLPLTGVVLCTALIMVAVLVVIRHWRRSNGQPPAPGSARGTAGGPAGKPMAPREIAIVPGFSDTVPGLSDTVLPDPGTRVPAQPGQAAHTQARPTAGPQPDRHGPGPPLNGQRAIARAVTASEQIASYYEQADKLMADYLMALGWAQQPPHSPQPPGPAERTKRRPPPSGDSSKAPRRPARPPQP